MNGQCETYRLNQPMKWHEFLAMPVELQITYVKKLREKYGVPDARIARMMFVNQSSFSQYVRKLGIPGTRKPGGYTWDKDGWYLFTQGGVSIEEPITSPECEILTDGCEFKVDACNAIEAWEDVPSGETISDDEADFICEQTEAFVETQREQYEEQSWPSMEDCKVIEPLIPIIPRTGVMDFEGKFDDVLKTLSVMLGGGNGKIHIIWDVA